MQIIEKIILTSILSFFAGYFIGNRRKATEQKSNAWGGRPDPGLIQDVVDEIVSISTGEPVPSDEANDLVNYAIQNNWDATQQNSLQYLVTNISDFDLDCLYQYYLVYKINNDLINIPSDINASAMQTIQNNNLPQ